MKIRNLLSDYSIRPRGVIHVGAHTGEHYDNYKSFGAENIVFIEPSKPAFKQLDALHGKKTDILLFNCAAGAGEFSGNMNAEKTNAGSYNSLLKPSKIKELYPNVMFTDFEQVRVKPVDKLPFKRDKYNFMVVTANGYEYEVLKGAAETIQYMDYLYVQVYKEPLYEGGAEVEKLDALLKENFKRPATEWTDAHSGYALYVRQMDFRFESPIIQLPDGFSSGGEGKVVNVPAELQPPAKIIYPENNTPSFEEWYFKNCNPDELGVSDRHYLPILWSNYYMDAAHGHDQTKLAYLQDFINQLDTDKKYFTISLYEDGIITDLSKLDIKVFAASGDLREGDYPLPMLCQPHKFEAPKRPVRDMFASLSSENKSHVCSNVINQLTGLPQKYHVHGILPIKNFTKLLLRSTFTICPRDYSKTSYLICEAMQMGSIPVYVSDDFIIPHNVPFESYGVLVEHGNNVDEILTKLTEAEIQAKQERIAEAYKKYYTYEGCKKMISHALAAENNPEYVAELLPVVAIYETNSGEIVPELSKLQPLDAPVITDSKTEQPSHEEVAEVLDSYAPAENASDEPAIKPPEKTITETKTLFDKDDETPEVKKAKELLKGARK